MTLLRVEHTPDGDESKKETWDIEFEDLTVGEVIRLEDLCDKFEPYIVASIGNGSKNDIMQLLYLWRQRTEPALQWSAIEDMRATDVTVSNPDLSEEGDGPKDEAADPLIETPTED